MGWWFHRARVWLQLSNSLLRLSMLCNLIGEKCVNLARRCTNRAETIVESRVKEVP